MDETPAERISSITLAINANSTAASALTKAVRSAAHLEDLLEFVAQRVPCYGLLIQAQPTSLPSWSARRTLHIACVTLTGQKAELPKLTGLLRAWR